LRRFEAIFPRFTRTMIIFIILFLPKLKLEKIIYEE